jgi:enoyl-CoA hydratase/carnithine racemase
VPAAEALAMGLVDRVVAAAAVFDEAKGWAASLASGPHQAHALAKRAIDEGLSGALAAGLDLEQALFEAVFDTPDAQIGVRSFLENGPGKARFS